MGILHWDIAADFEPSYKYEIEGDEITLWANFENQLSKEQQYRFHVYTWDEKLIDKEPDLFWKKVPAKSFGEIKVTSKLDPRWNINTVSPKFKVRIFEKARGEVSEAHITLEEEPPPEPPPEEPPVEPPEKPSTLNFDISRPYDLQINLVYQSHPDNPSWIYSYSKDRPVNDLILTDNDIKTLWPVEEYPKDISREPYSFTARNPNEETQLNDFLGIDPPGDDIDIWLAKRDLAGLNQWKDYWISIFGPLGRSDLLTFISNKYEEYKAKLEVPPEPPDERPWYIRVLDKITEFLEEDFTVRPLEVLQLGDELFNKIAPEEWTVKKVDIPSWVDELLLWVFFMPPALFQTTGEIEAGLTITQSNKILQLLKDRNFIKALDIMKANPTKYAKDFATLPPKTAAEILKGMRKDQLAGLATSVFKASWDDALIKTAPLWRRVMFAVGKHKWKGFFGLISLGGLIMGTDLWGNWSIVDNLQFMSGREADDILNEVEAGRMTKEDALKELNQMLEIVKAGEIKVKTSAGWNVMQILFAPLWDDLAKLSVDKLESAITKLEAIEPITPEEQELIEKNQGILNIAVSPADAVLEIADLPEITSSGTYNVLVGNYTIKASKEGYYDRSATAIIKLAQETTVSITLTALPEELPPEEVMGKLTINVMPEDAVIEVAGQTEITSSGTYSLNPGSYDIRASKEGFVTQTKSAFVSDKKDTVVSFVLEEVETPPELPTKATIQIISNPTNSDIYIDGAYTWTKTPYTTILDAGTYIIRIQTDGFFPQEASVSVSEGDEIIVPFILEEIPEPELPVVEYLPQEPWLPEYVAPTYYQPAVQTTPYSQVSLPSYPLLSPPSFKIAPKPSVPTTLDKEVLINIETTDAKPWKGNIFSIAWLDLSMPEAEPQVIVDADEQGILKAFIDIFEAEGFTKVWGFKTIFDYRFIFNKLMLYRMQSKAFFDAELGDVKQLMDQVKEAFVYFPDKTGKLDDYGKELLGIGKYGTQEALLRRYIAGDIAYVERFQMQQIQVTKGLYDLFRFSSSGSAISPILSTPEASSPVLSPSPSQNPISAQIKKCSNCLAEQPIGAKECDICKTKL